MALLSNRAPPAGITLTGVIELPLELGQVGALVFDSSSRPADRHCRVRSQPVRAACKHAGTAACLPCGLDNLLSMTCPCRDSSRSHITISAVIPTKVTWMAPRRYLQMWVGAVELKPVGRKADGGPVRVELEARKVVAPGVGPRLFLDRTPRLPRDTPQGLRELRERELAIVKVHTHTADETNDGTCLA